MREEYTFRTSAGETLLVREWGDAAGPLVIFHHGTPSSSIAAPGGWDAADSAPVRLCTFDRPGYGGSPRTPGRIVADAARWSREIADLLGRRTFAVVGSSGGGPHAAAAAALCPDRVTALGLIVSLGPYSDPEERIPELPADTMAEAVAARAGEAVLRAFYDQLGEPGEALDAWMGILPPSDREVLAREDVRLEEEIELSEWSRAGVDGWCDDDLALFGSSWGFEPSEISIPTTILAGEADVLVPVAHAEEWLARVPHADLRRVPEGGHWLRDHEPDIVRWAGRLSS